MARGPIPKLYTFCVEAIDPEGCTLVLVDYQQRLMPAIHGGEAVVRNALLLADVARELGISVIGTEQNPAGLGPNVAEVRERCAATLAKDHFDACADGLLQRLPRQERGTPHVVIAGCEAHVCLLQTALGLLRAGYRLFVVADACGSRAAENHRLAMERLRQAGAVIVATEMVAFEWLRTCRNERFKAVLERLKRA
jgi:nicotinamidase-related amidase